MDMSAKPIQQWRDDFQNELFTEGEQKCPCCDRMARINSMKVHSTLVRMLIRLRECSLMKYGTPLTYVHIEAFKPNMRTGNDFSIVKHWGLAKPVKGTSPSVKSSGMWKLTPAGELFLTAQRKIPKYAYVYNDAVIGYSEEEISLAEAINDKFDLREVIEEYRKEQI